MRMRTYARLWWPSDRDVLAASNADGGSPARLVCRELDGNIKFAFLQDFNVVLTTSHRLEVQIVATDLTMTGSRP